MTTFSQQKVTIFAVILLSIYHISTAEFLYQDCYDAYGTYDILSDYGANVDEAITQLASLASTSYFDTISVGKGTDKVNAVFSCRYDITSEDCQSCVASTADRVSLCFRSVESIQFYQDCTLHYSNYTIFKTMETLPRYSIHSLDTVSDDGEFDTLLSNTIDNLISDTVAEFTLSSQYFSTATADYSTFKTIYALAQCNADITSTQCSTCLQYAFGNFTENYPGAFLGQVFMPSCRLSYKLSSVTMSEPYDFSITIVGNTPVDDLSPPPTSSPVEDSPSPPITPLDEGSIPPPSTPDEDLTPTIFADELSPPPPSSLYKSTGTRILSTTVAGFLIVLSCLGLLI